MVQPGDYQRLIHELPNVVQKFIVEHEDWNHMDFLTGKDAHTILYPHILDLMKKHTLSGKILDIVEKYT